jgi:hypothetical protein
MQEVHIIHRLSTVHGAGGWLPTELIELFCNAVHIRIQYVQEDARAVPQRDSSRLLARPTLNSHRPRHHPIALVMRRGTDQFPVVSTYSIHSKYYGTLIIEGTIKSIMKETRPAVTYPCSSSTLTMMVATAMANIWAAAQTTIAI